MILLPASPPKNYKISSAFSYNFKLALTRDYLRRSHVLVVCGHAADETVKNDIATAERLRITATTLDGILTVKGQGREKGGAHHA